MSIFIGTAGYVSTFIAQYFGAKQYDRIGLVLWQGVYISVAGLGLLPDPLTPAIFRIIGHDPVIQRYEVIYFRVLCYGAVLDDCLSDLIRFLLAGRERPGRSCG